MTQMHRHTPLKTSLKLNITDNLTQIVKLISSESQLFMHIDTDRILVCTGSNRQNSGGGTFGKLVPLKFKDGSDILKHRGRFYTMPKILNNGNEILYIIYFYIPKFFDLPSKDKLNVIFHELYHISPEFNGDIRRMGKVKAAHGASKKVFDLKFREETERFYEYLSGMELISFLEMNTKTMQETYKKIYARRMKLPRPVIIDH